MIGIYVHIPFCVKKCNYCDFASYPELYSRSDEYVTALCREVKNYDHEEVDTIYFGGGTPSLLSSAQLSKVMDSIMSKFSLMPDAEITIEVNPGTIDEEKAKAIKNAGFNRVSIGSQSFSDSELKTLGRIHKSSETLNCFEILRNSGFHNISMDLMYAIPGQTMKSLSTSIRQVLKLSPEHISCYGLKFEEGTPFYNMLEKGELSEKNDDEYADMYEMIRHELSLSGYEQYELSNFSKKGYESKHNLKYWLCNEYIGLGLGASSYYGGLRQTKTCDFEKYIESFDLAQSETLTSEERMSEYMFLSLRLTKHGANKETFKKMFNTSIEDAFSASVSKHIKNGMLTDLGDRYILAERAYYVSNSILCDFV